jgi:SAM-dependent methyltransferase
MMRARSFSRVADVYERARPGYPEEAVLWLAGTDPCRVVDVGAGTGKLTRQLVALGHEVTAVEPSAEMLARLRAAVPAAEALEGSAEAIPLPDGSVDVVVAGQAFHWFDPVVSLPEIARILRPDGRLGLIWNMRDERVPWVGRLSELLGSEQMEDDDWPAEVIAASGRFGPVEHETFALEQSVDRQTLLDLVASRSLTATREPEERAALLERVGALYDELASGELVLPYVTDAFRTRRR